MVVCLNCSYKESNIPLHPCFQLIANSEQILNARVSRRLISMEKVHPFEVCLKYLSLLRNKFQVEESQLHFGAALHV